MSEMKDVRALIEQIDALLAINANGNAVPRIPGLAVELLTKARAALDAALAPGEDVAGAFANLQRVKRIYESDGRPYFPVSHMLVGDALDMPEAQAAQIASLSAKVAEVERERDEAETERTDMMWQRRRAEETAKAAEARASELQREVEGLRKALSAMLKEHDILSGNYGSVMDRKHLSPDRWPSAASKARAALQQEGE